MEAWHRILPRCRSFGSPSRFSLNVRRICLPNDPNAWTRIFSNRALLAFSVPSLVITNAGWYGNVNPLCIDYALRPRLSSRLTLGGRTLPRKPYPFGDTDSNRIYRYLCPDSHFQPVHRRLPLRLQSCWNASLPPRLRGAHIFGTLLSPDHFRRRFTRWVSYYALFK